MRLHYHGDCEYFKSNGAVHYCGFFHGYPSCSSFRDCDIHRKQKEEKK